MRVDSGKSFMVAQGGWNSQQRTIDMAKVRGDDEIFEILNMMGGDRLDREKDMANGPDEMSPRNEDEDGGGEGHQAVLSAGADDSVFVPEDGWNRSIWNPHVLPPDRPTSEGTGTSPEDKAFASEAEGSVPWKGTKMRLVSPQEEALRQQAVAVVFSRFQVLCEELGIRAKNEMLERWQFSRKLKEGRGGDPILPASSFFDPGLDAELRELGVTTLQAKNVCCELGRASKQALKTLKKQLRAGLGFSSKGVLVKRADESTYVLQLGKNRLRLNSAHYDKMEELFRRTRGEEVSSRRGRGAAIVDRDAAWMREFHDRLLACLMRYETLQGGGFQASVSGDAFDVLLRHFGVRMECFASPFNCRYARYCSAFTDTDSPFGSVGSFFDFRPKEGAFQANPPFVRDVILKMSRHMDKLLEASSGALTFVVIIPAWEDAAGWVQLRESAFLTKYLKLDQKDHGYCEGKQHLRRNRYRIASFHTSVFFLQTAEAALASPVTQEACDELAHAFALKQEGERGGVSGEIGREGDGGVESGEAEASPSAEEAAGALANNGVGEKDGADVMTRRPSLNAADQPHAGEGGYIVGRKAKRRRCGEDGRKGLGRSAKGRSGRSFEKDGGRRRRRSNEARGDMAQVKKGEGPRQQRRHL